MDGKLIYGKIIESYTVIYKLLCMIFFVFLPVFADVFSQTISCKILDTQANPIPYVDVFVPNHRQGTISNREGIFNFDVSKYTENDSLYISHLSYQLKKIPIKELKNESDYQIILEEAIFTLPQVIISAKKRKMKVLKPFGVRFPGAIATFSYGEELDPSEEIGDFFELKKNSIVKEFRMRWIENTFEKLVFQLLFYKVESDKSLTPLVKSPIIINISKINKKTEISKTINEHLPEGKIWVGLKFVDFQGNKEDTFSLPITFSGGWMRYNNDDFEKFPLGLGFSFSIRGYTE